MLKRTKDFRLAEWKKILTEVNSSGMSKRAWRRANGINERKLYYWQHLIWQTESTRRHLPAKQDLPVKSSGDMPDNGFVEVNLQSIRDQADCPASHQAGTGLVLQCSDCRIFVPEGVSEATLSTVLRAVRNA